MIKVSLTDRLTKENICTSKGEARRVICAAADAIYGEKSGPDTIMADTKGNIIETSETRDRRIVREIKEFCDSIIDGSLVATGCGAQGCMFNKEPKGMSVSGCKCVPDSPRKLRIAISSIIQMANKRII